MTRTVGSLVLWAAAAAALAQDVEVIESFEAASLPKLFEVNSGTARLVAEGATDGKQAMEIAFDPSGEYRGAYLYSGRFPRDWSAYDALVIDVTNPSDQPVSGYVLIADRAWSDSGSSYWNRHNGGRAFPPGTTQWIIPVRGLYRGEAGSRNNDIRRDIDPDAIVRVDLGFGEKGEAGRIVIDHIRLVKTSAPQDVWAFDFGPPSQSVMLGWKPVSDETKYAQQLGYGWGPQGGNPWSGAARDTTFGTALLQDFCECGGYRFHLDVPAGKYRVAVIYENSGYWGGEQAQPAWRRIAAGDRRVWEESRPDGRAHALYRFEDVEPIGADIWDTYMKSELARPILFDAEVQNGGLTLRFESDRAWGSKISALAVWRADDRAGQEWFDGQMDAVAAEFRSKALCLDKPVTKWTPPKAWADAKLVAWGVRLDDEIAPGSLPPADAPGPSELGLQSHALRGEFEPFCVAVRPTADLGTCQLALEELEGPGELTAELCVVRYNTSRDFGQIAYHVRPHTLRKETSLVLGGNVTRMLVATVRTARDTPAGTYRGAITVRAADQRELLRVPLELVVHPVELLRDADFSMGFFGLMPPGMVPQASRTAVLQETLRTLRLHGMNALSGGPSWRIREWKDGQPAIDFGEMDAFFDLVKRSGFTRPINGYGGLRFEGTSDGYQIGQAGDALARQSGLSYQEALLRAWEAVDAHARGSGWPTILYAMCDETRVRETAERELQFMQAMAEVSRRFPRTVRTSGSYSVGFAKRPDDPEDLLHWHQRFFEALDISSLNDHDETVMAEAARLNKEIHIYNQGQSRFTFGLYQWSEYRHGVRARWQWHLNVLHGYQFFDLDGREPDTAMICYGRKGIYPTIHFERCREGAEDFYLYDTLRQAVRRRGADSPAAAILAELDAAVALNQRQPPAGFDPQAMKLRILQALEGRP